MARLRGSGGSAHTSPHSATCLGGAGGDVVVRARRAARLDAAEAAAEPTGVGARSWGALDRAELESALAEAIKADASGTLPTRAVSLEVLPFHEDASGKRRSEDAEVKDAAPSSLDALARVRVRVEAPWPLALVVPARSAEGYGAAGAFLAQLRRARAATGRTRRARGRRPRDGGPAAAAAASSPGSSPPRRGTSSRRSTSTSRRASWRRAGAVKTRWRARRRWRRRARRTPRF